MVLFPAIDTRIPVTLNLGLRREHIFCKRGVIEESADVEPFKLTLKTYFPDI